MVDQVGKFSAGLSYGPILSQTDLYLLGTDLQLNPILTNSNSAFHLVFNLLSGQTGGFNNKDPTRDLPFTAKDEPATLPRVTDLVIVTRMSPWCTIVHNDRGVTMGDVCGAIWKDYSENYVTDAEFGSLPTRLQEQMKRIAASNAQSGWNQYYSPAVAPSRYKRSDWLREKIYFEGLSKDEQYSVSRLGYKAPNIFTMNLAS